ncbi:MAG: hypothetical protein U0360_03840 [Dehalococcoidia bacterium]
MNDRLNQPRSRPGDVGQEFPRRTVDRTGNDTHSTPMGDGIARAQDDVQHVMQRARGQLTQQVEGQMGRLADSLEVLSDAITEGGQRLIEQDHSELAGYGNAAAHQLRGLAQSLDAADVASIRQQAERTIRERPLLALAGAFAVGMMGARLMRSGGGDSPSMANGTTSQMSHPQHRAWGAANDAADELNRRSANRTEGMG